jgi:hypothetical protein
MRLIRSAGCCASCSIREAAGASDANTTFELILQCRNGRWDQLSRGQGNGRSEFRLPFLPGTPAAPWDYYRSSSHPGCCRAGLPARRIWVPPGSPPARFAQCRLSLRAAGSRPLRQAGYLTLRTVGSAWLQPAGSKREWLCLIPLCGQR